MTWLMARKCMINGGIVTPKACVSNALASFLALPATLIRNPRSMNLFYNQFLIKTKQQQQQQKTNEETNKQKNILAPNNTCYNKELKQSTIWQRERVATF